MNKAPPPVVLENQYICPPCQGLPSIQPRLCCNKPVNATSSSCSSSHLELKGTELSPAGFTVDTKAPLFTRAAPLLGPAPPPTSHRGTRRALHRGQLQTCRPSAALENHMTLNTKHTRVFESSTGRRVSNLPICKGAGPTLPRLSR